MLKAERLLVRRRINREIVSYLLNVFIDIESRNLEGCNLGRRFTLVCESNALPWTSNSYEVKTVYKRIDLMLCASGKLNMEEKEKKKLCKPTRAMKEKNQGDM